MVRYVASQHCAFTFFIQTLRMNIKGSPQKINRKVEEIFTFLSDFRNFEKLMPEQISNWQADADSCSFEITGMASIELRMVEKKAPGFLKIDSEGKSPFPFSLITRLQKKSDALTESSFEIDADVNPVMSMMVKRPLENLVNMMNEKLAELFN